MISEQAHSSTRSAQSEASCSLGDREPARWLSPCAPSHALGCTRPASLCSWKQTEVRKGRKKRENKAKKEEEIQMGRSSISRVEVAMRLGLTTAAEKLECKEMSKSTEERLHSRTV